MWCDLAIEANYLAACDAKNLLWYIEDQLVTLHTTEDQLFFILK